MGHFRVTDDKPRLHLNVMGRETMMKRRFFAVIPLSLLSLAACSGSTSKASYPTHKNNNVAHPLPSPSGGTVALDNLGLLDGLYTCSLSNTNLKDQSNNEFNPTFYLSINGKADGSAEVLIADTSEEQGAQLNGGANLKIDGYDVSGTTSSGGAVSLKFSFSVDPATGYENVTGTGTVVLKGKNASNGSAFSNTAKISCDSVWNL